MQKITNILMNQQPILITSDKYHSKQQKNNNQKYKKCVEKKQQMKHDISFNSKQGKKQHKISSPVKLLNSSKGLSIVQACSKYKSCGSGQTTKKLTQQMHLLSQSLLIDEQPKLIDIYPIIQPRKNSLSADRIVRTNLNQKKIEKIQKKLKDESKQAKIKQNLKILHARAQQAARQGSKNKTQKKYEWGHNLYQTTPICQNNDKIYEQKQKNNNNKNRVDSPMILKPIEERIKQYQQSQFRKQQKKKKHEGNNCCHKHIEQQQIIQRQSRTIERSRRILQKQKQIKEQQKQKKKQIARKIKQIQTQSMNNIKKCKKKPVPEDGEFILKITNPTTKQQQKQIEQVSSNKDNEKIQVNQYQKNKNKKINYPKLKTKTKKNKSQTIKQPQKENIEEIEPEDNKDTKFYFWNIPIEKPDYQKIMQQLFISQELVKQSSTKASKSFKEEVTQYLTDKFKCNMEQQRLQTKQEKFLSMVEKKKQEYLRQYQQERIERQRQKVVLIQNEEIGERKFNKSHFMNKNRF